MSKVSKTPAPTGKSGAGKKAPAKKERFLSEDEITELKVLQ